MDLKKIQSLLLSFNEEIENQKSFPEELLQEPKNIEVREKAAAYCWIFADKTYSPLMGRAPDQSFCISSITQRKALPLFAEWGALERNVFKYQLKSMALAGLPENSEEYIIPLPEKDQTLFDYLMEISQKIAKNKGCKDSFWQSLRNFLSYIRETLPDDALEFIEAIFPKSMKTGAECSVRIIPDTQHPIDIVVTAQILKNLSQQVFSAPENIQKISAQALAFSWICLYSAHSRLMPEEKLLHLICQKDLKAPSFKILQPQSAFLYPTLILPSFFGDVEIPISEMLEKFLRLLPYSDSERFFSSPLTSLRRSFNRAVKEIPNVSELERITFAGMTNFSYRVS
jgi:hypothetical protein